LGGWDIRRDGLTSSISLALSLKILRILIF